MADTVMPAIPPAESLDPEDGWTPYDLAKMTSKIVDVKIDVVVS